jgi:hypothetical protein
MSNLTNGAKMLLECLAREGVDCFFGYPGGVTLPLYDAIYDHHIRHVLVRHEENACFAAEGYARATGKVRLWPAHLRQPLIDSLAARRREAVDLSIGMVRGARCRVADNEPRLLQTTEDDVDLAGVHPLPEWAERSIQASTQLVPVGGLLCQHRQHDFLLHGDPLQ